MSCYRKQRRSTRWKYSYYYAVRLRTLINTADCRYSQRLCRTDRKDTSEKIPQVGSILIYMNKGDALIKECKKQTDFHLEEYDSICLSVIRGSFHHIDFCLLALSDGWKVFNPIRQNNRINVFIKVVLPKI